MEQAASAQAVNNNKEEPKGLATWEQAVKDCDPGAEEADQARATTLFRPAMLELPAKVVGFTPEDIKTGVCKCGAQAFHQGCPHGMCDLGFRRPTSQSWPELCRRCACNHHCKHSTKCFDTWGGLLLEPEQPICCDLQRSGILAFDKLSIKWRITLPGPDPELTPGVYVALGIAEATTLSLRCGDSHLTAALQRRLVFEDAHVTLVDVRRGLRPGTLEHLRTAIRKMEALVAQRTSESKLIGRFLMPDRPWAEGKDGVVCFDLVHDHVHPDCSFTSFCKQLQDQLQFLFTSEYSSESTEFLKKQRHVVGGRRSTPCSRSLHLSIWDNYGDKPWALTCTAPEAAGKQLDYRHMASLPRGVWHIGPKPSQN